MMYVDVIHQVQKEGQHKNTDKEGLNSFKFALIDCIFCLNLAIYEQSIKHLSMSNPNYQLTIHYIATNP